MWHFVKGFGQVKDDGGNSSSFVEDGLPITRSTQKGFLGRTSWAKPKLVGREERVLEKKIHETVVDNLLKNF